MLRQCWVLIPVPQFHMVTSLLPEVVKMTRDFLSNTSLQCLLYTAHIHDYDNSIKLTLRR